MLSFEITSDQDKDIIDYFMALLPGWPDYVIIEWIFKTFKHNPGLLYNHLETHPLIKNTKWERKDLFITLNSFDDWTRGKLTPNKYKSSFENIVSEIELVTELQPNSDPIITFEIDGKLKLIDGWQRTMNNFKIFLDGYQIPVYIGRMQ